MTEGKQKGSQKRTAGLQVRSEEFQLFVHKISAFGENSLRKVIERSKKTCILKIKGFFRKGNTRKEKIRIKIRFGVTFSLLCHRISLTVFKQNIVLVGRIDEEN